MALALRFRPVPGERPGLPQARSSERCPLVRHQRPVARRLLAHHLGLANRARGRHPRGDGLGPHRRAARSRLRLLRRLAGPDAGADHGRALRVPVPPPGHRVRLPVHRHHRRRCRRRGPVVDLRLRAAVLPGRAQRHGQRPRGDLHRGGPGARGEGQRGDAPLRVQQRDPERARDRDAQRCRRHRCAGRTRASSGSASSPTSPPSGGSTCNRSLDDAQSGIWWTALLPGPGDRAAHHRADARRGRPQRDHQPGPAPTPAAPRGDASARAQARDASARPCRP